jgi:hypothetical protein
VTWWKQAAERWLLPVVVLLLVGGCGGDMPSGTAPPSAATKTATSSETSAPAVPAIGLTPLPSAEEVQKAAPGGRTDPFARLAGLDGQDSASELTLTGVLVVGSQQRALVATPSGTGVICVGSDGRCSADAPVILPTGWSVLSIDVDRGCIRLALNGEPQDSVCIA